MDPTKALDHCIYYADNFCEKPSLLLNGLCENHQEHISNIGQLITNEKIITSNVIRKYMNDMKLNNRENKILYVNQLFEFLCKHKKFIIDHETFKNTLLEKLCEFDELESESVNTKKYLSILFPLIFDERVCIEVDPDEDTKQNIDVINICI